MKLILTDEVENLGLAGDVVDVADGYGRNFLLPRGLAIMHHHDTTFGRHGAGSNSKLVHRGLIQ